MLNIIICEFFGVLYLSKKQKQTKQKDKKTTKDKTV
jgi:hypothetical protein